MAVVHCPRLISLKLSPFAIHFGVLEGRADYAHVKIFKTATINEPLECLLRGISMLDRTIVLVSDQSNVQTHTSASN